MNSKITNKKPIIWNQELVIKELLADPQTMKDNMARLQTIEPRSTEEQLKGKLNELVLRENYYNVVMTYLASNYEFYFDQVELDRVVANVKQTMEKMQKNLSNDELVEVSKKIIIKDLIYDDLQKEFKVQVTDDEIKTSLDKYFEQTGQSIREYIADRTKFEQIRAIIFEEKITQKLLESFKPKFDLDDFNKRVQAVK